MPTITQSGSKGWKIRVEYSLSSPNIAENSTTVTAKLYVYSPGHSWNSNKTAYYTIQGGSRHNISYNFNGGSYEYLGQSSFTIKHNSDGKKTFTLTAYFNTDNETAYTPASISLKASVTLPSIPRQANITYAQSFNDEDKPLVKYNNPAGGSSAVSELELCIELGNYGTIAYRPVSKTAGSYTFSFTTSERSLINRYTRNSSGSLPITYKLKTRIGGANYYSAVKRYVSTANATPTISNASITDVNPVSVALTGDSAKLIKGISTAEIAMASSAKKEASIVTNLIYVNNAWVDGPNITCPKIQNGEIKFYASDTRKKSCTMTKTVSMVKYFPPTCIFGFSTKLDSDTTASITIRLSGDIFVGSFGMVQNSATLSIRYRVANGTWSGWKSVAYTTNGNSYNASTVISGLDYTGTYEVQARIVDQLYNGTDYKAIETPIKAIKIAPVFDWGESDFRFNVPVSVKVDHVANAASKVAIIDQNGVLRYRAPKEIVADAGIIKEIITLDDASSRYFEGLGASCQYYPTLGLVFVRVYAKTMAVLNAGNNYIIAHTSSHVPAYYHALAVRCTKLINASIGSSGNILVHPHENVPSGYSVYVCGFWMV